ncbi:MAG: hypothetical protein R3F11_03170 [Verrucomicrobiales bacterium]
MTNGAPSPLALAVDGSGHAHAAWTEFGETAGQSYVRGNRFDISGAVYVAEAGSTTVQSVLDGNALGAGDVVLIVGEHADGFALTAADSGVLIFGAPGAAWTDRSASRQGRPIGSCSGSRRVTASRW